MEVSIGAIGAAIIAALVSLFGLILGKEQKTSEFRQAWVDALRSELVSYLTNINSIADKIEAGFSSPTEKIRSLSENYAELNRASFSIKLRVNDTEDRAISLLNEMDNFENLAKNDDKFTSENVKPIEAALVLASRKLLKFEWKRVKRGEISFVLAKWGSFSVLCAMSVMIVIMIANEGSGKYNSKRERDSGTDIECNTATQHLPEDKTREGVSLNFGRMNSQPKITCIMQNKNNSGRIELQVGKR